MKMLTYCIHMLFKLLWATHINYFTVICMIALTLRAITRIADEMSLLASLVMADFNVTELSLPSNVK